MYNKKLNNTKRYLFYLKYKSKRFLFVFLNSKKVNFYVRVVFKLIFILLYLLFIIIIFILYFDVHLLKNSIQL